MLSIEQIKERLAPMNAVAVAEATGLHPHTVRRLKKSGKAAYATAKAISDYLEALHGRQ